MREPCGSLEYGKLSLSSNFSFKDQNLEVDLIAGRLASSEQDSDDGDGTEMFLKESYLAIDDGIRVDIAGVKPALRCALGDSLSDVTDRLFERRIRVKVFDFDIGQYHRRDRNRFVLLHIFLLRGSPAVYLGLILPFVVIIKYNCI